MSNDTTRGANADLWTFYGEHADQARQNESLRATSISIMSGFAGAMAAIAANDGLNKSDLPVGIIITALGFIGFLLSLSHYAKSREHIRIMGRAREVAATLGGYSTDSVRWWGETRFWVEDRHHDKDKDGKEPPPDIQMKQATMSDWPRILAMRTANWRWWLWALLPLLVTVAGIVLIVFSCIGVPAPKSD